MFNDIENFLKKLFEEKKDDISKIIVDGKEIGLNSLTNFIKKAVDNSVELISIYAQRFEAYLLLLSRGKIDSEAFKLLTKDLEDLAQIQYQKAQLEEKIEWQNFLNNFEIFIKKILFLVLK